MASRAWCYTINHVPQFHDESRWEAGLDSENCQGPLSIDDLPHCKWQIYSCELGETGRFHIQGYACFSQPVRLGRLRAVAPDVHWEPRRGSHDEAKAYCQKNPIGDIVEEGVEPKGQGARSDLESGTAELLVHRDLTKFAHDFPTLYVKFNRGFEALLNQTQPLEERSAVEVNYFWGAPGLGKTWYVTELSPQNTFVLSDQKAQWWDGYRGESILVIDDLEIETIPLVKILQILQPTRLQVPKKGGFIQAKWTTVWITSNYPLEDHYSKHPEQRRRAFQRRITKVFDCTSNLPPNFVPWSAAIALATLSGIAPSEFDD